MRGSWTGGACPAIVLLVAACASPEPPPLVDPAPRETELQVLDLDEHFLTEIGNIKVIRVQDEFRVIRCITEGPIRGCFMDILTVPRTGLELSTWIDVGAVDGLQLSFLTPEKVAVRRTDRDMKP